MEDAASARYSTFIVSGRCTSELKHFERNLR
jgi:hypothetical protein